MDIKQDMINKYHITEDDWERIEFEILNANKFFDKKEESVFSEYKNKTLDFLEDVIKKLR